MIPKIIHAAWKDKQVLQNPSPMIVYGWKRLADMNPTWRFEISDDADIDAYLQDKMGSDYELVADSSVVAKSDIWRLYKMFLEGGLYVDIDRYCNVSLDEIIPEGIKQILPTCRNHDFSHDVMLTAPGNPIFGNAIDAYLVRRKEGHTNIYFLGAQTYMHAITQTIFGRIIDTNPGQEMFEQMRNAIDASGIIKTFPEDPPHQTLLYRGQDAPQDWEALKRGFYKEHGLRHWTGEW